MRQVSQCLSVEMWPMKELHVLNVLMQEQLELTRLLL